MERILQGHRMPDDVIRSSPVDGVRSPWSLVPIARIEDLSDAVLGAGLEAVQMTRGGVSGGLAFAKRRGIVFTSGRIAGDVALTGPLSETRVTLGLGLRIPAGSWHWHDPVTDGSVGVWHPGDEHDAMYRTGTLYASVTLGLEQLEAEAAALDLVLDRATLGGTGLRLDKLAPQRLISVRNAFERTHQGQRTPQDPADAILRVLIEHCARAPRTRAGAKAAPGHARIVSLARDYIRANLHESIRADDIAKAAMTSERTLYRAFVDIVGETPQRYIRRLRLHRIRNDLASEAETACTISSIAHHWGIGEHGRLAGWYRDLFGELPSATMAHQKSAVRADG